MALAHHISSQRFLLREVMACMLSGPLFRRGMGKVRGSNEIAVTVILLALLDTFQDAHVSDILV